MDSSWAQEHLQTIRTLMERAALYRRALAPIMLLVGCLGTVAGIVGLTTQRSEANQPFAILWLATAALSIVISYLFVRRQALKAQEAFWSPPTRRVTQALAPGFLIGGMAGILFAIGGDQFAPATWLLAIAWVASYGCALHAAGFFMERGIKLFGLILVSIVSVWLIATTFIPTLHSAKVAHAIMGLCFGVAHLLYGAYLHFTERRAQP